MENELKDFLEWYWQEIDGKPYRISALDVVEDYLYVVQMVGRGGWKHNPFQNDIIDAYDETQMG